MVGNSLFLELPVELRTRMYSFAGLERFCPINLAKEGHRSQVIQSIVSDGAPGDASEFCRSHEYFCLYRQRIRRLEPRKSAHNLECFCDILPYQILYICKQVYAEAQRVLYGRNKFVLPSTSLGLLSKLSSGAATALRGVDVIFTAPLHKPDIEAFLQFIRQLVLMVNLSTFSLGISCKADRVTSMILLDGLRVLQGIKELSLRLDNTPDSSLTSIIKSTTLTLTGRTYTPFRFTELPAEIRHLIISHTNLVPGNDSHQSSSSCIRIEDGRKDNLPHAFCCRVCTDSLAECACWCRAGAYSTQCTCYSRSFALFRVSRSLNADATYVCFSKNRFILSRLSSFASHLAFLLSLSSHAVYNIRQLDIEVSDDQVGFYDFEPDKSQSAAIKSVSELLDLITKRFKLSSLHLTLDFSALNSHRDDRDDDDCKWLYEVYRGICKVTASKFAGRGLDRFEVFSEDWPEEEDELEKMVMGNGYDALAREKIHWKDRSIFETHRKSYDI